MGRTKFAKKSDLLRLKQDIRKQRKLDKLDNLLLFASSLVGIIFIMLQYIFGQPIFRDFWILLFFPLLILGTIVPVRVGYFRGALQDSTINRVNGWIYFFYGLGVYVWFTILLGLINYLPGFDNFLFLLIIAICILAFILVFVDHLTKKVLDNYGYAKITKTAFPAILGAILTLAGALFITIGNLLYQMYQIVRLDLLASAIIYYILIGVLIWAIIFKHLLRSE